MNKRKRSDKDHRDKVSVIKIDNSIKDVRFHLFERLDQKGHGCWLSRHEIQGFLTEEYMEAVEAIHSGTINQVRDELIDIAVACIFGVACIDQKTLDW